MTTIKRIASKVFNREAALAIGGVFTAAAFVLGEIMGEGIWVEGNLGQTLLNALPKLSFLIAGAVTRFRVYSQESVDEIQARAAATGTTPATSPP